MYLTKPLQFILSSIRLSYCTKQLGDTKPENAKASKLIAKILSAAVVMIEILLN